MAEITPATSIGMIVYYAGLRDEYDSAEGEEKDQILARAKEIYTDEVNFDNNNRK